MKNVFFVIIFSLFIATTHTGCNKKENGSQAKELITNPASGSGVNNGTAAVLEFENDEYDFGTVENGQIVRYSFKFKNTGKAPLIISNASPSCGCTVPKWPKDPIAPNDTGSIYVEFNSANRIGSQKKLVTITSNTNPPNTEIRISGEVTGVEEKK